MNLQKVEKYYKDLIRYSRLLDNTKWFLKQELKMDEEELQQEQEIRGGEEDESYKGNKS